MLEKTTVFCLSSVHFEDEPFVIDAFFFRSIVVVRASAREPLILAAVTLEIDEACLLVASSRYPRRAQAS
jgi:hypothetical protein